LVILARRAIRSDLVGFEHADLAAGIAGDLGKSPVSIAEIPQLVERSASRWC
jgi:hypothetical protein